MTAESGDAAHQSGGEPTTSPARDLERHDPEYLDRDKLDFDPDDGLYSGTAVDGTSEIPGPHADGSSVDADGGDSDSDHAGDGADAGDGTDRASGEDAGDGEGTGGAGEGR